MEIYFALNQMQEHENVPGTGWCTTGRDQAYPEYIVIYPPHLLGCMSSVGSDILTLFKNSTLNRSQGRLGVNVHPPFKPLVLHDHESRLFSLLQAMSILAGRGVSAFTAESTVVGVVVDYLHLNTLPNADFDAFIVRTS